MKQAKQFCIIFRYCYSFERATQNISESRMRSWAAIMLCSCFDCKTSFKYLTVKCPEETHFYFVQASNK